MADFCRQCSLADFGEDFGDLAGLSGPGDTAAGLFCSVICEGCGHIQVDHAGNCMTLSCLEKGHPKTLGRPAA